MNCPQQREIVPSKWKTGLDFNLMAVSGLYEAELKGEEKEDRPAAHVTGNRRIKMASMLHVSLH